MKKMNNNGFSLVELIVVIAIMAILVGVLAPSVLGQLDKAKISKDKQTIETVVTAYATAYADQMIKEDTKLTGTVTVIGFGASNGAAVTPTTGNTDFEVAVKEIVGYESVALESSEYKGLTPEIEISANGKVTAKITGASGVEFTVTR